MATSRGFSEFAVYAARLGNDLPEQVLRGAARAAGKVIAEEAKARVISSQVRDAVHVVTAIEADRIVCKIQVKGEGAYIAPWLEYGTARHFIQVAESQRGGKSVGRINRMMNRRENPVLVIQGAYVSGTVYHPGARPHPFLRPALDSKAGEAEQAAQTHIISRIRGGAIIAAAEDDAS
jgi:hypothetical protein